MIKEALKQGKFMSSDKDTLFYKLDRYNLIGEQDVFSIKNKWILNYISKLNSLIIKNFFKIHLLNRSNMNYTIFRN